MDGVDNTKINMKLHTFYGLVQCAEIKCEHIILSVASVCTNGMDRYCLPTHTSTNGQIQIQIENSNPTPKVYCILDVQLQLACLLLHSLSVHFNIKHTEKKKTILYTFHPTKWSQTKV